MHDKDRKPFYDECSRILGIPHEYKTPFVRKRWTNRIRGNGRFEGFGLVQSHGSMVRVISKHGTRIFYKEDEVFEYLRSVSTERS